MFINEINRLEESLKKKIEEINQLAEDKNSLEKNLEENRQKDSWLKRINQEIENILNVNQEE